MIGIDIAVVARFEKHVDNPRFHKKILTDTERAVFLRRPVAENLAAFFAVKEAAAKALGTGIGRIGWRDIELRHTPLGQPWAFVHDRVFGRYHKVAVSITHDGGFVAASAMLTEDRNLQPDETARDLHRLLLPRRKDAHKGTVGRACVIGGKEGMLGSISLAAKAALRAGAGYSYAFVRPEIFSLVQLKLTEPIVRPLVNEPIRELTEQSDAMNGCAIGPGLGTDALATAIVRALITRSGCPLVLDADALTILAGEPLLLAKKQRECILTPHAGELSRLLHKESAKDAAAFARKYDIIVVEKGPATRIHTRDASYVNTSGNAGLATAGSGDVLTGCLAGLLARGYTPLQAARIGVWLHGKAGDLARDSLGAEGMIASDVLERNPLAQKYLEEVNDGLWEYLGGDRSGSAGEKPARDPETGRSGESKLRY
jgi:holo-[acyl-carrier-protein] synthase